MVLERLVFDMPTIKPPNLPQELLLLMPEEDVSNYFVHRYIHTYLHTYIHAYTHTYITIIVIRRW